MVKQYQLILLPILLVAAVIVTVSLKPWQYEMKSKEEILAPTLLKSKAKRLLGPQNPRLAFTRMLNPTDYRKMWTKNLFNPDREETEQAVSGAQITSTNVTMYSFELVGLFLIGDNGGLATIITTRKSSSTRYGRRNYRPRSSSRSKHKNSRPNKNYRVGDMIKEGEEDTGFRLTSVEIDHVILTRRNQRLKVELKRGGSAAGERRKTEAKAQSVTAKKSPVKSGRKAVDNGKKKLTPPPPPPMPVPEMTLPTRKGKK